ncbi:MAG: hypothetical protein GOMPHAMPRED_006337 [Gomphillus americanus]|uniref:Uncharacterized protein n=1 Tax=Gomphillus americanus TaxID=1940652 RepID=A0A8H3ENT5_9LECA|nr:MAG: hypothetical protein GOMPHAMPRED_006337 [Gomphillus americanus]
MSTSKEWSEQGLGSPANGSNSKALLSATAMQSLAGMSIHATDMMKHKAEHERVQNRSGITKTGHSFFDNTSIGIAAAAIGVAVGVGIHQLSKKKKKENNNDRNIEMATSTGSQDERRARLVEDLMSRHGA